MTMCKVKNVICGDKPTKTTQLCSSNQLYRAFYPLLADSFVFPAHKFHSRQTRCQHQSGNCFQQKTSDKLTVLHLPSNTRTKKLSWKLAEKISEHFAATEPIFYSWVDGNQNRAKRRVNIRVIGAGKTVLRIFSLWWINYVMLTLFLSYLKHIFGIFVLWYLVTYLTYRI